MTAQLLKKETMKDFSGDPAFLLRWLNGALTEEELTTLRNREEYEEMMVTNKTGKNHLTKVFSEEKNILLKSVNVRTPKTTNSPSFIKFALFGSAIVLLALLFSKINGWW